MEKKNGRPVSDENEPPTPEKSPAKAPSCARVPPLPTGVEPRGDDPRLALGAALKAANLPGGPRVVAMALWTYYRTGETCLSVTELGETCGYGVRHVRRCLRDLEVAGIIT